MNVKTLPDEQPPLSMFENESIAQDLLFPIVNRSLSDSLDLDWIYTSKCTRRWSPDALLTHLYSRAFSVPPEPHSRFLLVTLVGQDDDGPEVVRLPKAYRLPLLMVAKYLWETLLSALGGGKQEWKTHIAGILHISRLCENLFASARVQTVKFGMEKKWRCLMFDRFLTRFYHTSTQNDPASIEAFCREHGSVAYERNILKYDWKEFCLSGINGVKLKEEELKLGLTFDQCRKTLAFDQDSRTWTLGSITLAFITSEDATSAGSVSDLTDFDLEEAEEVKPLLCNGSIDPGSTDPSGSQQPTLGTRDNPISVCLVKSPALATSSSISPKKFADPSRLSTLRRSVRATPASAQASSTPSTNCQRTQPKTTHDSVSSHNQSASGHKPGDWVIVLKRRAVTQTTSTLDKPTLPSDDTSPSRLALPLPTSSTQVSKPIQTSRKRDTEQDDSTKAKRRKTEGLDSNQPKDRRGRFVSFKPIGPSEKSTSQADSRQASVQAITALVEQGIQTDIGAEISASRIDTHPMSTVRSSKSVSDGAVQTQLPSRTHTTLSEVNLTSTGTKIMDNCVAEMRNHLDDVVDNLVSSRMLAFVRSLKQTSQPSVSLGNDSVDPSLALIGSSTGSGAPRFDSNVLFDEVRLLREEAHAREQRLREEIRGLQHLHNAEVDSLRRRLAYLESQSHTRVGEFNIRGAPGDRSYRDDHTQFTSDDKAVMPPKYHPLGDDSSSSSLSLRPQNNLATSMHGNGLSERSLSKTKSSDLEECSPLPSKAQRKFHLLPSSGRQDAI